ncbi:hypothetical protein ACN2XU_06060 [Primorskyibacter sp. 2E107]|uniref:hypothetical protein n=1 Tax=Primorskyibacter sp. 2E107 TaxID=3403458 RepID=UPI003AF6A1F7
MSQGRNDNTAAQPLTLPERRVLTEAADHLLSDALPQMEITAEGRICTGGQPAHESACAALGALGVLVRTDHYTVWGRRLPPDGLQAHLETRALTRRAFDLVLQAFIDHAVSHSAALPDTRDAFALPARFSRIGAALMRTGHLAQDGAHVRWTDRIAPVMQEAILWDDKGQCLSEIWQAQEEAEARHFFAGLPERLREELRRTVAQNGGLAGLDLLRRHWAGRGWTEIRQSEPGDLTEAGFKVNVFTTFVRLIREGRG